MIKNENVANGVKRIMELYMQEDYDYVTLLARRGQRPTGINSISEEIEFIKRILSEESHENIKEIAKISFRLIKALNEEIYQLYNY